MAGSSIIGALRVVLGADTASFETGLKGASKKLDAFGAGITKAGAVMAGALAGALAGVGVAVSHAIDRADELGKMAQKVGVPVEELSALAHAADLSGVSIEQLSTGLGKLSKTMVEALAEPSSKSAAAFRALGISVTDSSGKLKSSSEIMTEVAGAFEGIEDGAGKTAISMILFGKAGKDLIPLLNAGKDGLKAMMDEAEQLGIVISGKTAKSAEAFNDNLTRLGKVKDGIILKITEGMLPGLEKMSAAMVRAAKDTEGMNTIGSIIGSMFVGVINEIEKFGLAIRRLPIEWTALTNALSQIPFTEASIKAWRDFNAVTQESERLMRQLADAQKALPPITLAAISATLGLAGAKKELNVAALGSKDALGTYIKTVEQSNAAQQIEIATSRMSTAAAEAYRIVQLGKQKALEDGAPATQAEIDRLTKLGAAAGYAATQIKGIQLVKENLAPEEAYRVQMQETTTAMIAAGASSDQLARAQEKVKEKFQLSSAAIGSAMADIAGSFSSLLGAVGKDNKALGIASKAFGIAQVIINTQIAITKALATLPPPASYVAAAVVAAQGAASIATIASQGFARGGSFRVGGSGGMDSQMINFMATPGEMVDVRTPGTTGSTGSGSTEITLRGRRLTDMLTLDDLRDLIDSLNSANRDGYKLKVAT
jgi:hypothetical protein